MPKKPSQLEAPNTGLTREDRKNEQICRMIEKAEKQRLKREEKKKLQVSEPPGLPIQIGPAQGPQTPG